MLKQPSLVGLVLGNLVISARGIELMTGDNPIKAQAFIVDPQGRRFGRDPQTGTFYSEIPNIGYGKEFISADDGSGAVTPEVETFYVQPFVAGTYTITVYALESSTYTLVVSPLEATGFLAKNGMDTYQLTINPTPGAPSPTLVKVGMDSKPVLPLLACVEKPDPKGHWGHRHGHHKFRGHRRRHPFAHHRHPKKDKDWAAVFGYENKNNSSVEIAVGQDNKFFPAPEDRGQTETFEPGLAEEAFEVPFDKKGGLTWTLKGPDGQVRSVTADKRSPECE